MVFKCTGDGYSVGGCVLSPEFYIAIMSYVSVSEWVEGWWVDIITNSPSTTNACFWCNTSYWWLSLTGAHHISPT